MKIKHRVPGFMIWLENGIMSTLYGTKQKKPGPFAMIFC